VLVGAVCHGPAGLVNVQLDTRFRLVEGRRTGAYTNDEEVAVGKDNVISFFLADRLEEQGAIYVSADIRAENDVVDERLVTGPDPASAAGMAKEMEKFPAEAIQQDRVQ
jgi:putative intracellular protease/amidase